MDDNVEMLLLGAALGAIFVTAIMFLVTRSAGKGRTTTPAAPALPRVEEDDGSGISRGSPGETAGLSILVLDADGKICWANPFAEETLGEGRSLVGSAFSARFGIDHARIPLEPVKLQLSEGSRYYAIAASNWTTTAGEPRVTIVLTDVSALKLAEDDALAEQRRFRSLAENTNDMIVTIGLDRIRRYVSSASERLLGYTPEEMMGESPLDGIHPDDRAHVMEVSESLLRGADSRIAQYRHLHKDGHYVWLEASFRTIVSPDTGEPVEFVGSVRDISDRNRDELEDAASVAWLKESNRLLAMAESLANVGHWRVDLVSGKLDWSDEVYRIHGLDKDYDLNLQGGIEFYHEEDRSMVAAAVERSIATGEGFTFSARLVRPTGEIRHVDSIGQAEVSPSGETIGLFGVFEDNTETVVSEMALRRSRDEARAAMEAKTTFLANMSHEIRTPMNGVIGFAEVLLNSDLDAQQHDQAEMILQSGKAMLRLLNELLDLSKIEAGQMSVSQEPVDIAHIVRSSLRLLQPVASEKGLKISADIAPSLPAKVMGDSMRIRQILLNLIGNALKFTDEGSVTISVGARSERIEIAVHDTGIGIRPERQQAIFDEFVQADSGIAERRGGTGLGLSIAKQLLVLMQGQIRLESAPGQGSTFYVDLPLLPCPEEGLPVARKTIEAQSSRGDLGGRRVLLAEDNEINQLLVKAMAERLNVRLDIASDGKEAIAMVQDTRDGPDPFKLVLMDLQMPNIDGYTATAHLREAGLTAEVLPIVALTANAYPEDVKACLAAGMQAHLTKPLALQDLQDALERWLLPPEPEPEAQAQAHPDLPPELLEKYQYHRRVLEETLQRCGQAETLSVDDARELAAKLHDIAGMAAVFGEPQLGDRAAECEHLLRGTDPDDWRRAVNDARAAL